MTEKAKKPEHQATEHVRHTSAEARAGAGHSHHAGHGAERASKQPAYRNDPNYRKLLEQFQSAAWEESLHSIDKLLKAYPGDEHLLAFKQDVKSRSAHQTHSEKQWESDEQKQRRRVRRGAVIAAVCGAAMVAVIVWFVRTYQAEETRQRLAAEATQTAEALASQNEMADIFMKAGKVKEALVLYQDIQEIDPGFEGIVQKIEAAQLATRVEDLYQQGTRAQEEGATGTALELLESVEELQPEYKDTAQRVEKLKRDQEIARLVQSIDDAYSRGDSAAVIESYEAIQAVDPFLELPDLDDELFTSYEDLVLQIAAKREPTLEEIQAAARYYRAALALFPQSIEYSRERAELQEIAIELPASQYYLQGISLLESSDYSIEGLQQSLLVLQRAREKAPESPVVDTAIEKSQLFIESYEHIVHGDWDDAIAGFDSLYARDPEFADGRVRHFLYEAYTARGDLLILNADFGGAFADYQAAEKFAWAEEENVLRIFQIEVRVAHALHRLAKYDQAAEFYRFAFEQAAIQVRLGMPENADMLETLRKAEAAQAEGNELVAISFYEELVEQAEALYELNRITARRGDTLPNIAFENGSTLASLRAANELGDSLIVSRTQPLSVPILQPAAP